MNKRIFNLKYFSTLHVKTSFCDIPLKKIITRSITRHLEAHTHTHHNIKKKKKMQLIFKNSRIILKIQKKTIVYDYYPQSHHLKHHCIFTPNCLDFQKKCKIIVYAI